MVEALTFKAMWDCISCAAAIFFYSFMISKNIYEVNKKNFKYEVSGKFSFSWTIQKGVFG